jgi:RimJ/RimL family protein N-acetyltransferase
MIIGGEAVARFVSDKLQFGLCPPYTALGIERDGEIVAGALLNNFEGASVHLTAAGAGWTRAFLKALGEYVFDQLGCERITAITRQDDVAMLARRLGFRVEGRLRSHFGAGHDGIVLGVLRDEWKY